MKVISFALLLGLSIPAAQVWAGGTILEADYPNQYDVISTGKSSKLMVAKSCTMALRDRAKANVVLNVERKGYVGSCNVLDTGKTFRGRENQKKNQIELVIPLGEDKARVENWEVVGTVDTTPSPAPSPAPAS